MIPNILVDSRDVRFVLFEMLQADAPDFAGSFADFDRETIEAVLDLAERIAMERVYPAGAEADRIGARYDPVAKKVTEPAAFVDAMKYFNEAGFSGIGQGPEWGGMGMPEVVCRAAMEYFFAASISFTMHASLSNGAANLVKRFAPERFRKICLENMASGRWGGTMCLTEPDAGSDVGALRTVAVPRDDGSYLITGQKIFISAGDNDLYENIIHPVLARIHGDPSGAGGVSIFLVPKFHINPDGSIGGRNDVVCSGIEHKMGIKGSPTCTLNFGDEGRCIGYLMGGEREGMKIMFRMMNEARLDVALQGLAASSSAYLHAVTYAKNRVQGYVGESPCAIIRHPDVRRMLLWMKSQVEAMRMITLLAACSADAGRAGGGEESRESRALLDFLIPICKAGNTDLAWLVTAEAIQVFGGYGYCADYPVERLARDSKILSIYEGTNGIQSMDLAMRKLLLNPDQYNFGVFSKRMRATIEKARGIVEEKYVAAVEDGLNRMEAVVRVLLEKFRAGGRERVLAIAVPLQRSFVLLSHAWMHLWALSVCVPNLKETAGEDRETAFYRGKVLSSRFFIGSEFKKFDGYVDIVTGEEGAAVECNGESFTGAPEE